MKEWEYQCEGQGYEEHAPLTLKCKATIPIRGTGKHFPLPFICYNCQKRLKE